jgi:hypothetical protein
MAGVNRCSTTASPSRQHTGHHHRTHSQPFGAFAGEHARDFDHAMSICVGLDYTRSLHAGPYSRPDVPVVRGDLRT